MTTLKGGRNCFYLAHCWVNVASGVNVLLEKSEILDLM